MLKDVLITGFFSTVKQDFTSIVGFIKDREVWGNDVAKRKVQLPALRTFAALGLTVFSSFCLYKTFTASTVMGKLFKLSVAVASYVINHDVFVFAKNVSRNLTDHDVSDKGFFSDVRKLIKDKGLDTLLKGTISLHFKQMLPSKSVKDEKIEEKK